MGNANTNIDNTTGTLSITANRNMCECRHDIYIVDNEQTNVSVQYLYTDDIQTQNVERSYIAGISGEHCVLKNLSFYEAQKVTLVIQYNLIDYVNENSKIKRFHGFGHIIFRNNEKNKCTSIQVFIDTVNISEDGHVVATYVGYFEKDFCFHCVDGTSVNVCTTFMFTVSIPPP
jgi:hypothetical protein